MLAPFTRPRTWIVLAMNAVPVAGVFALGWSPALSALVLWFDGFSALAVMLALQIYGFARNDPAPERAWLVPFWVFLVALLGAPYWFMALAYAEKVFPQGLARFAGEHPDVGLTLLVLLCLNVLHHALRRYDRMADAAIRREFQFEYAIHLGRCAAILLVAFFLPLKAAIVALALALSWVEIYPERTLRAYGLDPADRPRGGG